MSDYTKSTNFATKDTLPSGNSGKILKGTEIDTEFNAIAGAITSKADKASPTFTGTPAAPTATLGSNTTQIANTAFVKGAVDDLGTIGTMAAQNKTAVDITGGTIVGITDLAVADGGTGASALSANAVLLGNGTSAIQTVAPSTSGNVLTSNGTTWQSTAPAVVRGLGLGGEVWNNVTGSRAAGSTYTNSHGYPIMISVNGTASGTSGITVSINGSTVYFNQAQWNGAGAYPAAAIIIPNGATYSVSFSSSGLSSWWELY